MHTPITLLLPVKNGETYLPRSIADLGMNAQPGDEILVVDDGSVDATPQLLNKWRLSDTKVRIIRGPGDGLVKALNLGIREASNNWIARFDVDDHYSRERLSTQRLQISPQTAAIFSDYRIFSAGRSNLGTIPSAVLPSAVSVSLVNSQRTPHPSVLYNRDILLSVGGYRAEDFPAEDLSLWLRLSRVGDLISVPMVLLDYRISSASISGQNQLYMLEKKRDLLSTLGIHSRDIEICSTNWMGIFNTYESMPMASQRKWLLLHDLRRALKLSGIRTGINQDLVHILREILQKADSIPSALAINAKALDRKLARRFNT